MKEEAPHRHREPVPLPAFDRRRDAVGHRSASCASKGAPCHLAPHAVGAIWPGAPRVRAASIASGERERNEVDGEATRKDKEEEKKRRKERKREIKKEIFYLILDIVIPKFYFAYYCYISKIEYDSYIN
jgi:hypothetical protein